MAWLAGRWVQLHRHQHQVHLAHRIGWMLRVVLLGQRRDKVSHRLRLGVGWQVELDDRGKELLHEQPHALAALFVALRSAPPLARWLAATPPIHRMVLYVLLGATVAGHFTLSTRKYFPFVAWDIFSSVSEQETVFCRELVGTTATGQRVRLLSGNAQSSLAAVVTESQC